MRPGVGEVGGGRPSPGGPAAAASAGIAWGSARARWVLAATVGASALAMLDATMVNVALPAIGADLGPGSPACSGRSTPTP